MMPRSGARALARFSVRSAVGCLLISAGLDGVSPHLGFQEFEGFAFRHAVADGLRPLTRGASVSCNVSGRCAPFYRGPAFLALIISSNKSMKGLAEIHKSRVVQLDGHMKRLLIPGIGLGLLLSASLVSHAAQTAQARIFCLSLRLQQGV